MYYVILDKMKPNRVYLFSFSFIVIIISGLRWRTGTDWLPYEMYFHNLNPSNVDDYSHIEYGYRIFMLSIKNIFSNYSFFLFFQSLIVIGLKVLVSLKMNNIQRILFCTIYLLAYCFNIFNVRQDISISLILVAIVFYNQGLLKFTLITLLASLFHKSAIICLLFPFIYLLNKRNLLFFTVLISIIFISFIKIDIGAWLPDSISYKYYSFVYEAPESYTKSLLGQIMSFLTKFPYVIFLYYSFLKLDLSKNERYITAIALLGFILSIISISSGIGMLNRIAIYFYITELYIIPILLVKYSYLASKKNSLLLLGMFLVIYLGRFYSYINSYSDLFIPFESILEINFKDVY
ncbi:EpsG family protein [Providencia rettgeri]